MEHWANDFLWTEKFSYCCRYEFHQKNLWSDIAGIPRRCGVENITEVFWLAWLLKLRSLVLNYSVSIPQYSTIVRNLRNCETLIGCGSHVEGKRSSMWVDSALPLPYLSYPCSTLWTISNPRQMMNPIKFLTLSIQHINQVREHLLWERIINFMLAKNSYIHTPGTFNRSNCYGLMGFSLRKYRRMLKLKYPS